jgi:hypothetical protein
MTHDMLLRPAYAHLPLECFLLLRPLISAVPATPLADLTPLSNSQSLRRLYLGGSRARDLAPVLGLPSLKFIQNAMYAYIYVAGKGAT